MSRNDLSALNVVRFYVLDKEISMLFKENTVVYVGCPKFYKTGGTELAHQLVKVLRDKGKKAEIVYYDAETVDVKNINPAFTKYVKNYIVTKNIEDTSDNILIAPEVKTDLLDSFTNIQKVIWWMSVDNYLINDGFINRMHCIGFLRTVKSFLLGGGSLKTKKIDRNIDHLYQSEYARTFLVSKGVTRIYELSDYLNDTYLDTSEVQYNNRKNYVLYNPRKGIKFTRKLIKAAPDLNWKPIQNMTTEQVRDLLLSSKVYIDFGNHPGKDRFPREAAISGCCIITGKRGSAGNDVDVKIPKKYKFADTNENIDKIIVEIRECLSNYDSSIEEYSGYRQKILGEKKVFDQNVEDMISNRYN